MRWTSGQLCSMLHLPQVEDRPIPGRLVLDSRQVKTGDLFLALPGERTDGHSFISQALASGAWVLAEKARSKSWETEQRVLAVENTKLALADLGIAARAEYHGELIGITGSNGKTTTKELLHRLLATTRSTGATQGNLNSTLGVPLTLVNELHSQDVFVLEAGASAPGEIARICEIARPGLGCITNIAAAHLERFGDLEGVAAAKGELMNWLAKSGGSAVVNDADPLLVDLCSAVRHQHSYNTNTGLLPGGHRLQMEGYDEQARARLSLDSRELVLGNPGRAFMQCSFAALAIALAMDTPVDAAWEVLTQALELSGRMRVLHADGRILLDDSYNSNPASLEAALDTLSHMQCRGKRLAVLAGMGELGSESSRLHYEAGQKAASFPIAEFLVVGAGELEHALAAGLRDAGASANGPVPRDTAAVQLQRACAAGDILLLKGSRTYGLEKLLEVWL